MTKEQYEMLGVEKSPLNVDVENQLVVTIYDKDRGYGIQIGKSTYWSFGGAQMILNNLEKHIEFK